MIYSIHRGVCRVVQIRKVTRHQLLSHSQGGDALLARWENSEYLPQDYKRAVNSLLYPVKEYLEGGFPRDSDSLSATTMILVDDKQVEALEARRQAEEEHQEPPPTYASLQASAATVPAPKPSNFVSINRIQGNVKESIILDPLLYIPAFLLPPLADGETEDTRKNLRIETLHGYIHTHVSLLPENVERDAKWRRVSMYMKSTHGGITAKVHGTGSRPLFLLNAHSVNGNIHIHLPRSFRGPIVISLRHGSVKFSDDISQHLTMFGEADGTRRCFVGNFMTDSNERKDWKGDEVVVEARHGSVKIQYDDDVVGAVVKSRPSFLNRVFGF